MKDFCKNCGELKTEHIEGKRKFTDEDVLVCGRFLFAKGKFVWKGQSYTFEPRNSATNRNQKEPKTEVEE